VLIRTSVPDDAYVNAEQREEQRLHLHHGEGGADTRRVAPPKGMNV